MRDEELTDEQTSRFRRDGFLRVPGLLSEEEVDRFGEAVDRAVEERTRHDPRPLKKRSRYEQSFRQCLNLWEDQPEVRPLSFHPRVGRAAAALLETEAVRIWHDQALYKESGGRETDPHQDQPYWSIAEPRTITAWIPFQPVRLKNGAVGFLPGSHRSGLREFANIFSSTGLDLDAFPETRNKSFDYVEAERGDVVFHHGLTVHRAYPNTTAETRRAHTVIFFADGCTRSAFRHPSVDRPGIAVGAPIESELTPIAWPRPGGDPPPAPRPPRHRLPGWPASAAEKRQKENSA